MRYSHPARIATLCGILAALLFPSPTMTHADQTSKTTRHSVFYPPALVRKARENVQKYPWAAAVQQQIAANAQPWMVLSDDQLWSLMFGNTIKRAWQVWSNGYCPACKQSVPMYSWQMDALNHPWKTRCPHCGEYFPKNDFGKFYQSGLDEHGVFDPKRADRSLLYNTEHPDPKDPLHAFGVDDGEGYVADGHRWRFIGAYLIFGQWKQAIVNGIRQLAAAYTVTGDAAYAHKAGVLLDRVADLYPTMDFGKEGVMYEGPPRSGYVSTWHDACEETREMALAYDQVRDALAQDEPLAAFLARKAQQFHPPNPKTTCADVVRNIEARILRDALNSPDKIYSNYPRTEYTVAILKTVLGWPENRAEVMAVIEPMLQLATAVDGVTGEKGLTGYSCFTIQGLAEFLSQFGRIEPGFLKTMFQQHPRLKQTWQFFLDTWCAQQYYPNIGDTSAFARRNEQYVGVTLMPLTGATGSLFAFSLAPSMYAFLWQLYEITGDARYVQALYHGNGNKVEGLPHDLFADDPARFQQAVQQVIAREGAAMPQQSVNKAQWHLALLRSGQGAQNRTLWLDYDSGGYHAHGDGMNIGLFAKGLDLLPDFGYPPVQYGGWDAPRSLWYMMTPAHNTVTVDGKRQKSSAGARTERAGYEGLPAGKVTLWADGQRFRAVRASGPEMIEGQRYERTVALVDVSDSDSYVFDLFRVAGGSDHAKFLRSHFGTITTTGLTLKPAPDYGHNTQMRNFQEDAAPQPGWSVDWKIADRYHYLPEGADVHLRYTDLTAGAEAYTAESWIDTSGIGDVDGSWIPTVLTRRQAQNGPLASTFVGIVEPYERTPLLAQIRRLPLETPDGKPLPDSAAAVEIRLADGRTDLLLAADTELPEGGAMALKDRGVRMDGDLCLIRKNATGEVARIALCQGRSVQVGDLELRLKRAADYLELRIEAGKATLVAGDPADIEALTRKGQSLLETR